jgi:hypothetical protein
MCSTVTDIYGMHYWQTSELARRDMYWVAKSIRSRKHLLGAGPKQVPQRCSIVLQSQQHSNQRGQNPDRLPQSSPRLSSAAQNGRHDGHSSNGDSRNHPAVPDQRTSRSGPRNNVRTARNCSSSHDLDRLSPLCHSTLHGHSPRLSRMV